MKTLEVVALTCDVPEKNLRRGQVGTVVALASMLAFAQETQVLTAHPKRTTRKQL